MKKKNNGQFDFNEYFNEYFNDYLDRDFDQYLKNVHKKWEREYRGISNWLNRVKNLSIKIKTLDKFYESLDAHTSKKFEMALQDLEKNIKRARETVKRLRKKQGWDKL